MIGAHRLTGHSGDETVVAGRSGDVVSTVRHTTTGRTGASGCSRVATVEVRRVDEVGRPGRERVPVSSSGTGEGAASRLRLDLGPRSKV
jgi:hypothetical protein